MSITARLDRLTPNLTPHERAVLVLQALSSGQQPDADILVVDDPLKRKQLNGYLGLIYVANVVLNEVGHSLSFHAERLAEDRTPDLLDEAAALLSHDLQEGIDAQRVRGWRKEPSVTVPELLAGVAADTRRSLLREAQATCGHLAALQMIWQELAQEFDGESPVLPEVRNKADATDEELRALVVRLGGPTRAPKPNAASAVVLREKVEDAFRILKLLEV